MVLFVKNIIILYISLKITKVSFSSKYTNEKYCLSHLKKGDTNAFDHIFHQYKRLIFSYCLKFIKSRSLAEELTHDVFIKVWEKREDINTELSFKAYLHTICRNHIINYLKKASRSDHLREEIKDNMPCERYSLENQIIFNEYSAILNQAIEQLPPKRKQIYQLCMLKGKSYEDVAFQYSISRNAVKDHMIKAGKFVRQYLSIHADLILTFLVLIHIF